MFAWINRRCKQATGCTTKPFGGISIILVGDIGQLPPITDQVLYHNKPQSDLANLLKGIVCIENLLQLLNSKQMKGLRMLMFNKKYLELCKFVQEMAIQLSKTGICCYEDNHKKLKTLMNF